MMFGGLMMKWPGSSPIKKANMDSRYHYLYIEDGISEVDAPYIGTHNGDPRETRLVVACTRKPGAISLTAAYLPTTSSMSELSRATIEVVNALIKEFRTYHHPTDGFFIRLHVETQNWNALIVAEALKDVGEHG